ncbi:hypothetical protein GCM10010505_19630 [Kitasatospora aburaviensis]
MSSMAVRRADSPRAWARAKAPVGDLAGMGTILLETGGCCRGAGRAVRSVPVLTGSRDGTGGTRARRCRCASPGGYCQSGSGR